MILGMEIGLLIYGIIALVRGKFAFSKTKVAVGGPAYAAGIVAVLPLPLAFGLVLVYVMAMGVRGRPLVDEAQIRTPATIIEVGTTLVCFAVAMTIAGIYGRPPEEASRKKKRYREYDDDDEDDRPRRRRRSRADEEDRDDEDRPRRSRRPVVEDDDEPPRRPRRDDGDKYRSTD